MTSNSRNDVECKHAEQDHDILVFYEFEVFSNLWQSAGSKAFGETVSGHFCSVLIGEFDALVGHLMHPSSLRTDVSGSPCCL